MKKLFFTAVAVLAFSSAGFAEGKEVKVFRPSCAWGAAAAFNQVINLGYGIGAAWSVYVASYNGCMGTGYTSSSPASGGSGGTKP